MLELVNDYTVVIVTHNMQQAARVSDRTAFFSAKIDDAGQRLDTWLKWIKLQRSLLTQVIPALKITFQADSDKSN
jgi:phosphate transport system ATP-binding protein